MTWRSNAVGSIRVFEAAGAAKVATLVHASSVGAYSPAESRKPVDESWHVRRAFNVAADPVLDPETLGEMLGARPVPVPIVAARTVMAAAWRLHLIPAEPALLDLALSLPVMDISRARTELGWTPRHTATEAITEFLAGLREGEGMPTPQLDPRAGGPRRSGEFASGVGERP